MSLLTPKGRVNAQSRRTRHGADSVRYAPAVPTDWNDPDPETVQAALDDIVATVGLLELHVPLVADATGFVI